MERLDYEKSIGLFLIWITVLVLTGCSSTVPQKEYDAVCAEREDLKAKLEEMQRVIEMNASEGVSVSIKGSFVGTVRYLIPDYCMDDTTLSIAVVTPFQSCPFTIYVGELAKQLVKGQTYVFEIQEKEAEIKRSEYQATELSLEKMIPYYELQIQSVRLATEEDWGINSSHHLEFELDEG